MSESPAKKARLVTIQLLVKEDAILENPLGPSQELNALLSENAVADPESTILAWRFLGDTPENCPQVEVETTLPIFEKKSIEEQTNEILQEATKKLSRPPAETSLDDLVHDTTSQSGSDINNRGLSEQISYLLLNGTTKKNILDALLNDE